MGYGGLWLLTNTAGGFRFPSLRAALLRFYTAVVSQLPSWSADLRTRSRAESREDHGHMSPMIAMGPLGLPIFILRNGMKLEHPSGL